MDENAKKPFLKPSLIYGIILGFVGILFAVIWYVTDLMFKGWAGFLSIAVTIATMVFLLRAYRNEYLGGLATYGRLVLMSLMIGLISGILAGLFNYVLYYIIDTDLVQRTLTFRESKFLANPRIPESAIDRAMEKVEQGLQPAKLIINGIITSTIFSGIVGLIAAIFLKKESENPLNDAA